MKRYPYSATYERYTNHDEDMAHAEGLIRSLLTFATILAVGFLIMVGCYQTTAEQLRDVTAQRDRLNAAILATDHAYNQRLLETARANRQLRDLYTAITTQRTGE